MAPVIEMSDVSVVVGGVTLLAKTSIGIEAGQALVVRGRNGTGKSTLLRVLAGKRRPSTGTVTIAGAPVARRDRAFRSRVCTMIGLPPFAPDLTVKDHVALVAATWMADADEASVVSQNVMGALGLEELGTRYPHELSSAQTQLFGLGLALARPFDVLILDEPEQRLDSVWLAVVTDTLVKLRDDGATLVVASHSPALTERLADRTLELGAVV